jgi:hypothetical protein
MMYGNSSMGFSFSPDRSRDVDRFNPSTRGNYSTAFSGASGSRQGGYYYSPSYSSTSKKSEGEWKQSGSGAWYKG